MNIGSDPFDTLQLSSVRAANAYVDSLKTYPTFIHKWSKQRRAYTRQELIIPETLLIRGHAPNWEKPLIGVGGTRSPTVETFDFASKVCGMLAAFEAVIVSGGVPGVDLAAHISAVSMENGATVAVLANPVCEGLKGHEWSNDLVERAIVKTGALLSEYNTHVDVGVDEFRERLLQRDRIITGLSDIFLVFECNNDSATVDAAYRALSQGKSVIAIEPSKKTFREGVQQLISSCPPSKFSCLRQKDMTPKEIAEIIMQAALNAKVQSRLLPPTSKKKEKRNKAA